MWELWGFDHPPPLPFSLGEGKRPAKRQGNFPSTLFDDGMHFYVKVPNKLLGWEAKLALLDGTLRLSKFRISLGFWGG